MMPPPVSARAITACQSARESVAAIMCTATSRQGYDDAGAGCPLGIELGIGKEQDANSHRIKRKGQKCVFARNGQLQSVEKIRR